MGSLAMGCGCKFWDGAGPSMCYDVSEPTVSKSDLFAQGIGENP